jgi:hypothetical protein
MNDKHCRVICMANSFTRPGDLGHWQEYEHPEEDVSSVSEVRYKVPRKSMGRVLGRFMRANGWKLEDTGFWNGRPQIWTREEAA